MSLSIHIVPSDDLPAAPAIDLSLLQCYVVRNRTRTWMPATRPSLPAPEPQTITKQVQCETRVVYRVFRDNRPPLDMCNQHFNEYFERRNIDASRVIRLSDDEEDFVPAARRMKKVQRAHA
jgi:hypothetical protein